MAKRQRSSSRSRPDHYTRTAKRDGYAARSVYKLSELALKYNLLVPGDRVLDLGAAPGSWSQFSAQKVGQQGSVVAVDFDRLDALSGLQNVTPLFGDFTNKKTLRQIVDFGPFDVVISDAAPATTGNRILDTARSAALIETIVDVLPSILRPGGRLAAKLFQGGEEHKLLTTLRRLFDKATMTKPKASRDESFETYLLGLGYRSHGK